jgi:hypothetical protein
VTNLKPKTRYCFTVTVLLGHDDKGAAKLAKSEQSKCAAAK